MSVVFQPGGRAVHPETMETLFNICNVIVAIAMFSIAGATTAFAVLRKLPFRSVYLVFSLFYFFAGCGRLYKALHLDYMPTTAEFAVDGMAGLAAVFAALLVWPVTLKALRLPGFELKSLYASIVEYSSDAIYTVSPAGIVTSWNRGAQSMYGYTAEEMLGVTAIERICSEDGRDEADALLELINRNEAIVDYETTRVTKSGNEIFVSITASPVFNDEGTIIGVSVISRDITMRRRFEQHVRELNDELRIRVMQLDEANKQLEVARDQALESSQLKSTFVANISHELRTPLSGILGMNEILLETELDEDQRAMATTVKESGTALLGVVNDILDLSKIEAGKVVLERMAFNPAHIVQDTVKLLVPAAHNKQLALKVDSDPLLPSTVFGDSARIRQILINLVGNAVKFTESGSVTVEAKVERIDEKSATLYFAVKDTGIGISPEERRFLFAPFQQVDNSSTRRFGGTGLGLTISKKFVELMGGEIGLESEKGRGSTFWFRIPVDRKQGLRSAA